MTSSAEIVICGAGIAGISAAYHLSVKHGITNVLLVDERPPLSLTSDKSTECYRNWWPGPGNAMVELMNRSIDLMENLAHESDNVFNLSRRGYLYLTGDVNKIPALRAEAQRISAAGAGPLRIHDDSAGSSAYLPAAIEGFTDQPDGADLILDPDLLREHFPYLTTNAVAGLHIRRAGWFSAQQLGAYLLSQARAHGTQLTNARISEVEIRQNRVQAVHLQDGRRIETQYFVNAAGPLLKATGQMLGVDLPVFSELHLKAAFKDTLGIVPRQAPLLIWTDPQRLPWTQEERQFLSEEQDTRWLLDEFPPGVHTRPEGGQDSPVVLMLWEYRVRELEPVFPLPLDHSYPDIVLRGLATMLPGLRSYFEKSSRPILDGGYYTRTRENRPLIGPLPVQGAYVIGALSGFGLMSACAAGELLAAHLNQTKLPSYANAFSLERYNNPGYLKSIESIGETGQL
jgi:glycine/D-amino acid oxidase-like deaminating enzyme